MVLQPYSVRNYLLTLTCVSLIVASTTAAAQEPSLSAPQGDYEGDVSIPHIARYSRLPTRMEMLPLFIAPSDIFRIDPRLQPLFDRTLRESSDPEFQEVAALSLARIAREDHGDISGSADILTKTLAESKDVRIRRACALALIQADYRTSAPQLLEFAATADDSVRLLIEPSLARWRFASAESEWKSRLNDPLESSVGIRLACEGLVALESASSSEAVLRELHNVSSLYSRRMPAARALSQLSPEQSIVEAAELETGNTQDRLLCVAVSANTRPESLQRLLKMCEDESQAVAAAAWLTLYDVKSDELLKLVELGRRHSDAVVRMTAARMMNRFPSPQHMTWLNALLSDTHIEVRNVARQMLVLTNEQVPDLRSQIITECAEKLAGPKADWQGIEQALLILGQIHAKGHSPACIPLLNHGRAEVEVTAAWLMHLYPDRTTAADALQQIADREAYLLTIREQPDLALNTGLQLVHLFQLSGLLRETSQLELVSKNFEKTCPGGELKRAAAMWSIGLSHQDSPLPELVGQLEGRVRDRGGPNPEREIVRRMSAMALGWMNSRSSEEVLKDSLSVDPPGSLIPQSSRWVLMRLGFPELPEPAASVFGVGGWKLLPAEPLPAELLLESK